MGVYFPTAKTEQDLSPDQFKKYKEFNTPLGRSSPELHARLKEIDDFIGPVTSGEILAAREELREDAFVSWILADEDPTKVEWVKLEKE